MVVSVKPDRPHHVAPGSITTYVLRILNTGTNAASAEISLLSETAGWTSTISESDQYFQPSGAERSSMIVPHLKANEGQILIVSVGPDPTTEVGTLGTVRVDAHLVAAGVGAGAGGTGRTVSGRRRGVTVAVGADIGIALRLCQGIAASRSIRLLQI